jgi:hypothetical protein
VSPCSELKRGAGGVAAAAMLNLKDVAVVVPPCSDLKEEVRWLLLPPCSDLKRQGLVMPPPCLDCDVAAVVRSGRGRW